MSIAHHVDLSALLARDNVELPRDSGRFLPLLLMGLGALGIVVTAAAAFMGDDFAVRAAFFAYHVGYIFACGLALGALGVVMALYLTNGSWGITIRRQFENLCRPSTFIILAVLGLPMLFFGEYLFNWQNAAVTQGDVVFHEKEIYLNPIFFLIRYVVYFAAWTSLAFSLNKLSREVDVDGDKWKFLRAQRISYIGMVIYSLTVAFASFDWLMSLDYHFFSTMWGVYFFAGNFLSAFCFVTLVLVALTSFGRLRGVVTHEHFHDLGKLIFGFTVFWAYISFSQYFLIWYANIPEETSWLQARRGHGWMAISSALVIGKFILPFIFLLARPVRRKPALLAIACLWLLGMHLVEIFWIVRPQLSQPLVETATRTFYYGGGLHLLWTDFVAPFGPALLVLGWMIRQIATGPLIPIRDPRLPLSLSHKNYI